jgi:hypothetical protein
MLSVWGTASTVVDIDGKDRLYVPSWRGGSAATRC